jgi:hypothetical protein
MATILNAGASVFDRALDDFLKEALKLFEDRLHQEDAGGGSIDTRRLGARQFVDFLFGRLEPARGASARRGKRA